ncbi:hypothetical protein ABIC51_000054 [Burkholderia sp. 572]
MVTLERAPAIERTRRADARQQERQREIARDLVALRRLPRHADHERRIRLDRELLAVGEERVHDVGRRRADLSPDELRIRDAVAERRLGHLYLVRGFLDTVQEIAPLAVQIAVDDRRDPEPAGDQDQDRDDDAAPEHRNALVAANGLKRAVWHDSA